MKKEPNTTKRGKRTVLVVLDGGGHEVAVGIHHLNIKVVAALGHGLAVGAHGVDAQLDGLNRGGLVEVLGPRLGRISRVGVAANGHANGALGNGAAVQLHRHDVHAVQQGLVLACILARPLVGQLDAAGVRALRGASDGQVEWRTTVRDGVAKAVERLDGEAAHAAHFATLHTGSVDLGLGGVSLSRVDGHVERAFGTAHAANVCVAKQHLHGVLALGLRRVRCRQGAVTIVLECNGHRLALRIRARGSERETTHGDDLTAGIACLHCGLGDVWEVGAD